MKNAPYVCDFTQDYISAWHSSSQQIKNVQKQEYSLHFIWYQQ